MILQTVKDGLEKTETGQTVIVRARDGEVLNEGSSSKNSKKENKVQLQSPEITG